MSLDEAEPGSDAVPGPLRNHIAIIESNRECVSAEHNETGLKARALSNRQLVVFRFLKLPVFVRRDRQLRRFTTAGNRLRPGIDADRRHQLRLLVDSAAPAVRIFAPG